MEPIRFSLMKKDQKDKYNKMLIGVLSKFQEICSTNNLHYSLGYGSVIGAVRHNGIIPWDDDIDVFMPRPDYENLVKIVGKRDIDGFGLILPEDTKHYNEPFARFSNKTVSLVFHRSYPYDMGVFIDIFPIDGASDDQKTWEKDFNKFQIYLWLFRLGQRGYSLSYFYKEIKKGHIGTALYFLPIIPFTSLIRRYSLFKMNKIRLANSYEDSKYVAQYRNVYGVEKERIPKEWIERTIEVPFENIKSQIPEQFDAFLRHYYGDYMQLPPEDERDDRHEVAYLNMDKKEDIRTILRLLDKN